MFKAAIALFLGSASANRFYINDDFKGELDGSKSVDYKVFDKMWSRFNLEFQSPSNKPEAERKYNFQVAVEEIRAHNSDLTNTWQKGINQFSDMTHEEFMEHFHMKEGVQEDQHCSATHERQSVEQRVAAVPDSWDWRANNGVTPVKNQGSCGSCWTFSTVGALEAHELLKYKEFTPLSEQQLVDCAGAYDNHGCEGGLPSHAFEYVMHSGGISTETAYPYYAVDHQCTVKSSTYELSVQGGSVNITEGDEVSLKNAVFQDGPVSVAFQVVSDFSGYKSGVYSSKQCHNTTQDVNHAVLAAGYGTENGMDYWIVKNSWGTSWGDKGYFKIERGVNMCGIAVCNAYPKEVTRIPSAVEFFQ